MDKETLKALKKSIKHHEFNRDHPDKAKIGPASCALCMLFYFYHDVHDNCEGCPVMEKTSHCYCEKTPYDNLVKAFGGLSMESKESVRRFVEAEKKEIDFLKSLLPGKIVRKTRKAQLTSKDAEKYQKICENVELEFPPVIKKK